MVFFFLAPFLSILYDHWNQKLFSSSRVNGVYFPFPQVVCKHAYHHLPLLGGGLLQKRAERAFSKSRNGKINLLLWVVVFYSAWVVSLFRTTPTMGVPPWQKHIRMGFMFLKSIYHATHDTNRAHCLLPWKSSLKDRYLLMVETFSLSLWDNSSYGMASSLDRCLRDGFSPKKVLQHGTGKE